MPELRYPKVFGYKLVEKIGGGGFSTVFRAVNFEDHLVAACKVVSLTPETTDYQRKMLDKELRIHAALKHRHILEFINVASVELGSDKLYYPGVYMLLELAAGGDLFDKIAPDVGLDDDIAQHYFVQLIMGLTYIHDQGVCHRDLKPENLLLDSAGTLKISDFGLCSVYKLKDTGKTRLLTERCGSLPYIAPELATNAPYSAEPVDVWGSGVILFALLAGNTPWDEPTKRSYEYSRYLSGECYDDEPWNKFSTDIISLLSGMLAVDPLRRMTLAEVSAHPWMTRPSQLAHKGPAALAEQLTAGLRTSGDLAIATPDALSGADDDGDTSMQGGPATPFTQTLLLFSQTQSGRRYTAALTRFYIELGPSILVDLIGDALGALGVKSKVAPSTIEDGWEVKHMRIGGHDRRRALFKGWVEIRNFSYGGRDGAFVLMTRDQGNPISWRLLWKSLIQSETIEPHVMKKKDKYKFK